MLQRIDIDRKTCVGPSTYAGYTPRRLIQRKRSDAEIRKLQEANIRNSLEKPPLKRQKRLKFAGTNSSCNVKEQFKDKNSVTINNHHISYVNWANAGDIGIARMEMVQWEEWITIDGEKVLGDMKLNDPDGILQV